MKTARALLGALAAVAAVFVALPAFATTLDGSPLDQAAGRFAPQCGVSATFTNNNFNRGFAVQCKDSQGWPPTGTDFVLLVLVPPCGGSCSSSLVTGQPSASVLTVGLFFQFYSQFNPDVTLHFFIGVDSGGRSQSICSDQVTGDTFRASGFLTGSGLPTQAPYTPDPNVPAGMCGGFLYRPNATNVIGAEVVVSAGAHLYSGSSVAIGNTAGGGLQYDNYSLAPGSGFSLVSDLGSCPLDFSYLAPPPNSTCGQPNNFNLNKPYWEGVPPVGIVFYDGETSSGGPCAQILFSSTTGPQWTGNYPVSGNATVGSSGPASEFALVPVPIGDAPAYSPPPDSGYNSSIFGTNSPGAGFVAGAVSNGRGGDSATFSVDFSGGSDPTKYSWVGYCGYLAGPTIVWVSLGGLGSNIGEPLQPTDAQLCFSSIGLGLSPSSWLPALGRGLSCLFQQLLVPSNQDLSDFTNTFSKRAPLSYFTSVIPPVTDFVGSLSYSVASNRCSAPVFAPFSSGSILHGLKVVKGFSVALPTPPGSGCAAASPAGGLFGYRVLVRSMLAFFLAVAFAFFVLRLFPWSGIAGLFSKDGNDDAG